MKRLPGLLAACSLAACTADAAPPKKPNVIVVLSDAMRARSLGAYGNPRPASPNFDRWAARSVLFEDAISQSGWTPWSMVALFASLDVRALFCSVKPQCAAGVWLAPEVETIAERFQGAGYTTAALVRTWALDEQSGFAQGFDRFEIIRKSEHVADGISGQIMTDAGIAYIDQQKAQGKPFFLYLHYMDAHAPYRAPKPYYDQFSPGYTGSLDGTIESMQPFIDGSATPTPEDVARLVALYDGEIAYWDAQFGRLLDHLAKTGLDKNTVLAVTADHGEGFWEHKNLSHSHVWQENLHVPLVVSAPGAAPRRVKGWVPQNALGGTVAELAGIGVGAAWTGGSLAAVVKGAPLVPGHVHSVMKGWRVVITPQGKKLVADEKGVRLFDLVADPGERTDVAANNPDEVKRLQSWLRERKTMAGTVAAGLSLPVAVEPSAEDVERKRQLELLGYTEK